MNDNDNPLAGFPPAASWSLHTGEAGKYLVIAALVFFVLAGVVGLAGNSNARAKLFSGIAFVAGSLSLFGAFGCLATLFVKNQFQFQYVFSHSDVHTPTQYRFAAVWSGQQGSFLLWATTSAIFGLLTLWGTGKYRPAFTAVYAAFLASLCGILAYESPFNVMAEVVQNGITYVPPTGNGLEPALFNYWIVIHPPTIFLGFGSLAVLFAYAVAAIFQGDLKEWVDRVRPWSLVSLAVLGLGICMGGFWAYETMGWGGFWGWDPVENASFIPWIFVATFIHALIVQKARSRWHGQSLIFGVLPFLTFCYGTFLTRGGFLDKVSNHSFASMDKIALKILAGLLSVSVFGFIALYLWKGRPLVRANDRIEEGDPQPGIRREGLYSAGMLLMSLFGAVLTLGISWPLIANSLKGQTAKIEEGAYHKTLVWFFIPIMVAMAVTTFASWRPLGAKELWKRISNVFCVSVGMTGVTLLLLRIPDWGVGTIANTTVWMPFHFRMATVPWVGFLVLLCTFTFVANAWRAAELAKRSRESVGGFIAHLGFATVLAGLVISRGFEQKATAFLQQGRPEKMVGYTLSVGQIDGPLRDRNTKLDIDVTTPSGERFTAKPGLYYRPSPEGAEPRPVEWPFIQRYAAHDFYLSLGEPILTVWPKEQSFQKGQTVETPGDDGQSDLSITYLDRTIEGTPGTTSAVFGARLKVVAGGKEILVRPTFSVGNGPSLTPINDDLLVAMPSMNAADGSVNLQVYFRHPVYPVEVFTKPLTGLVWGGTGILTLGGLISAFARRRRKVSTVAVAETPLPIQKDASIPVAQS